MTKTGACSEDKWNSEVYKEDFLPITVHFSLRGWHRHTERTKDNLALTGTQGRHWYLQCFSHDKCWDPSSYLDLWASPLSLPFYRRIRWGFWNEVIASDYTSDRTGSGLRSERLTFLCNFMCAVMCVDTCVWRNQGSNYPHPHQGELREHFTLPKHFLIRFLLHRFISGCALWNAGVLKSIVWWPDKEWLDSGSEKRFLAFVVGLSRELTITPLVRPPFWKTNGVHSICKMYKA